MPIYLGKKKIEIENQCKGKSVTFDISEQDIKEEIKALNILEGDASISMEF